MKSEKILIVVVFLAGLALPGALFVLGIGPSSLQNESLEPPPSLAADRLLDPVWFEEISGWYETRVPVRPLSVKTDAWIDRHLFADSPNPRVLLGDDDWLFLRRSFLMTCAPDADGAVAAARLTEAAELLTALGKDSVILVAPDKASIYPELVPAEAADICDRRQSEILRTAVEEKVANAIPSWSLLERHRDDFSLPVYEPGDTHWTSPGSTMMVREIVRALEPGLWSDRHLITDPTAQPHTADLTDFIGLPQPALPPIYRVVRPGAITTQQPATGIRGARFTTTGVDVAEGPTLVVHDSFGRRFIDDLPPFFADSTWIDWRTFEGDEDAERILADAILRHDRIIIEIVERATYRRAGALLAAPSSPSSLRPGRISMQRRWTGGRSSVPTPMTGSSLVPANRSRSRFHPGRGLATSCSASTRPARRRSRWKASGPGHRLTACSCSGSAQTLESRSS